MTCCIMSDGKPDNNRFGMLSINWNDLDNSFGMLSINRSCPDNRFGVLSMITPLEPQSRFVG